MQKLRYGVFQVRDLWKVYSDTESSGVFADRPSAVAAAERAALSAMASGWEVELHLQDVGGEFHMADVSRLAH